MIARTRTWADVNVRPDPMTSKGPHVATSLSRGGQAGVLFFTVVPAQMWCSPQGVAVDWMLSFRINPVGLKGILGPHQRWTAPGCS